MASMAEVFTPVLSFPQHQAAVYLIKELREGLSCQLLDNFIDSSNSIPCAHLVLVHAGGVSRVSGERGERG